MNLLILFAVCLILFLPAVFCIIAGGLMTAVGILALAVWGYLLWLVIAEYRECKNGCDEENP